QHLQDNGLDVDHLPLNGKKLSGADCGKVHEIANEVLHPTGRPKNCVGLLATSPWFRLVACELPRAEKHYVKWITQIVRDDGHQLPPLFHRLAGLLIQPRIIDREGAAPC